jgi:hypothetical protein
VSIGLGLRALLRVLRVSGNAFSANGPLLWFCSFISRKLRWQIPGWTKKNNRGGLFALAKGDMSARRHLRPLVSLGSITSGWVAPGSGT